MDRLRVYIGWDPQDLAAFEVCVQSLRESASVPVEVVPLVDHHLRKMGLYWRAYAVDNAGQCWDDRDGKPFSTQFSFTRFAVPLLAREDPDCPPWVLFMDADMLFRADPAELLNYADDGAALYCVKHDHRPPEGVKGTGLQTRYNRKNWSSFMWINVSHADHAHLTRYRLNNETGAWLHSLAWVRDEAIGALPEEWNWLEGWSSEDADPKLVHFTRGTPDMPGYEAVAYADEWRDCLARRMSRPPFFAPLTGFAEGGLKETEGA